MLDEYHQKYANKLKEDLELRINEKEKELYLIKKAIGLNLSSPTLTIAVMGCADKRFVKGHRDIFSKVFDKPVSINTFDITIEHLQGEHNIYRQDCTKPLPFGPYDITFAHVILRFVSKEDQWDLVLNSYKALKSGGVAIHVLDPEDYETTEKVDLPSIEAKLASAGIKNQKVTLAIGLALVLFK